MVPKAIQFIQAVARKFLAKEGKGITSIANRMQAEAKAGEIAETFRLSGLTPNKWDEFIKSENDVVKYLNIIESSKKPKVKQSIQPKPLMQSSKPGDVIDFPPDRVTDWTKARPQPPEIEIIDGVQTTRGMGDLFERQMKNIGKETDDQIIARLNKGNKKSLSNMRYEKAVKAEEAKAAADEDYIMKVLDPEEFAEGGVTGLYQGGQAQIEPNLSDIGHGSDALMARNALLTPGSQATTSTGLNYLLGEDNDTTRVPYKHGDMVLPKEKPMDEYMLKQVLSPAGIRTLDPKTREMFIEMYKKKIREKNKKAHGGPARQNFGMGKRAFLKWMASGAAGIGAAKSGLFSLLKGGASKKAAVDLVTTPNVAGKPVWFDTLVNRVIREGDDVSKKFGTKDLEVVHTKKINDFEEVTVTRELDTGDILVEYGPHMTDETGKVIRASNEPSVVRFQYKKGEEIYDTGKGHLSTRKSAKEPDTFNAVESEPRITDWDGTIEMDGENVVNNVDELLTDTNKLKQYATGKNPTIGELLKGRKKQKYKQTLEENPSEQINYIEKREGMSADDILDQGAAQGDYGKMSQNYEIKGINLPEKKADGGRVPLGEGGDPGTSSAEEVREAWKDYLKEKGTGTFKGSWKEFQPIWIRANLASGGRIGYGKGDIVTKGLPAALAYLRKKFGKDIIKKGELSKPMAPKTELKRSIAGFQEREAAAKLKPGKDELIIKNHTWDPKTGEDTSTWKIYKKSDKNRPPTEYEIEDYMDELPHGGEMDWTDFGNTIDELDNAVAEAKDYERYMYDQYKTGKLDKYMSMEAKGKRVLDADDAGRPSGYNMDEEYEIRAAMDEAERIKIAKWRAKEELAKSKESPWFTDSKTLTPEDELRKEFPGIDDKMIRNILTDKNPQRIAEVKATMKEALKMQQKGMGHEEIIQTFKKTKPTKHATGGRVSLSGGGLAGMLGE